MRIEVDFFTKHDGQFYSVIIDVPDDIAAKLKGNVFLPSGKWNRSSDDKYWEAHDHILSRLYASFPRIKPESNLEYLHRSGAHVEPISIIAFNKPGPSPEASK